jgi:8-amino-7-oxononanoate synthase
MLRSGRTDNKFAAYPGRMRRFAMDSIHPNTVNPNTESFLQESLAGIQNSGLNRGLRNLTGEPGTRIRVNGRDVLLLCSNNYLGLATDSRVKQAASRAIETYGCGATGSRLISGNLGPYQELEQELAAFKGAESSLVFSSGYHANIGTIPALFDTGDLLFSDALNHSSLIDGVRLSRAERVIYKHCDVEDLERKLRVRRGIRRKLILTESVFSMDGDLAPLREISFLAKKYGAQMMVDEAHGTGVFGPTGAGLVEELGLTGVVDIQIGTFSKALGSLGGYIAGSRDLIRFLVNRAPSFIFTTGLPPPVLAASLEALRIIRNEPERRQALFRNVGRFRVALASAGFELGSKNSAGSQILPIVIGEDRLTMAACRYLLGMGVFVQGIRPPSVPQGTARLRLTPMATHTDQNIAEAIGAFDRLSALMRAPRRAARMGINREGKAKIPSR